MKSRFIKAVEFTIFSLIILVIIQTIVEDIALLLNWEVSIRTVLIVTGFVFDLIFTIEFLVRLYWAIVERRVAKYLFEKRGWIDFLASIPLLMFNSGPALLSLFTGGSLFIIFSDVLNILKVLKAVRIARILRFLRVIKIFKNIKYAESAMAQRHIARITSLTVTSIVLILFVFSTLSGLFLIPGLQADHLRQQEAMVRLVDKAYGTQAMDPRLSTAINELDRSLLKITDENNTVLFARFGDDTLDKYYMREDLSVKANTTGTLRIIFDHKPVQQDIALQNILVFSIIIIIMICYLFIYSPHFAITVTDPLHVMQEGMQSKDYNLEVRIPKKYKNDDVFKLARLYNEHYLPLKDREIFGKAETYSELSIEDIKL
ncbi:MAG: ion transporter [Spirochaetales bacterium]|nr:ion transporter [Spirochaetales bacterium]